MAPFPSHGLSSEQFVRDRPALIERGKQCFCYLLCIPVDPVPRSLWDDQDPRMLRIDSPCRGPALPGVVKQDEVVLVVRNEDAIYLGRNEKVFIVRVPLPPEVTSGYDCVAGDS